MRIRPLVAAFAAAVLMNAVGVSDAHADGITPPSTVTTALANFTKNPQAAMTAWSDWAGTQPMGWTNVRIGRVVCAEDAARVTRCVVYEPNDTETGFVSKGTTTYTLADHKRQIIKRNGRWVYNDFGVDPNPITEARRAQPYDPWIPWLTKGIPVTTTVGKDGWLEVTSTNVKGGEDTSEVYVARVSPDGLKAQLLGETKAGKVDDRTDIVITNVPSIRVPKASKQKL